MDFKTNSTIRTGAIAGLVAVLCYFGAVVAPLPQWAGNLLGFAFGPLVIVSYLGIFSLWRQQYDGAALRISCVFGIIYGAIVTSLIFIQVANNMWHDEAMAATADAMEKERFEIIHSAVNRVQASLDVAFDIFVTVSVILLSFILLKGALFSKILGVSGVLIASLLLGLNLYTFPDGPYEAGLFDAGPFLGLWYTVFYVWMTWMVFRKPKEEEI